ncbi:MAG: hypothetical protein ACAH83_14590 [Alphaproteobacteria bacterium]
MGGAADKFNKAAAPPVRYCDWENGKFATAESWKWVERAQSAPTPDNIKNALVAVGFNDTSVRRLMEVNPRLAVMAAEAKFGFDTDLHHAVYDSKGAFIGHKSFQLQPNGGFRTVGDQEKATGAGNSQANAQNAESRHQHGQALDFWVMEPVKQKDGTVTMVEANDGSRRYPGMWESHNGKLVHVKDDAKKKGYEDFEHVARYFTYFGKRDYGIPSALQGDGVEQKRSSRFEPETRMRIYQAGGGNGEGYDWGHIQLPDRFDKEWERDPKTGLVWTDPRGQNWQRGANGQIWLNEGPNASVANKGVMQPNSRIDPDSKLHSQNGIEAYKPPPPPKPKPEKKPKADKQHPQPPKPGQGKTRTSS